MSISQILSLLDGEISRLQEARSLLAESVALAKMRPRRRQRKSTAVEESVAVTVLAPRVARERSARTRSTPDENALSAPIPSGVVSVSAIEAAKNRVRKPDPPAVSGTQWLTGRSPKKLTIDDLFRESNDDQTPRTGGTDRDSADGLSNAN